MSPKRHDVRRQVLGTSVSSAHFKVAVGGSFLS